jgi:hypothetical protein
MLRSNYRHVVTSLRAGRTGNLASILASSDSETDTAVRWALDVLSLTVKRPYTTLKYEYVSAPRQLQRVRGNADEGTT